VFYFCGPDESGASDAARRIAELLGPAEKIEMSGAELKKDAARLADEARSVSLFGDVRQIHVRTTGDETYDAVEALLDSPVPGWPVLIVAASATDKSRIAKLLADRPDALVAMFHPPDLRSVAGTVRSMGDALGLTLNGDLSERIALNCALDTRMARAELEKLALYLDADPTSPRPVTVAALEAVGASNEDDGLMPVVNVVLGGDVQRLPAELGRFRELGLNPVGLLLAMERRAAQLAALAGRLGRRSDIAAFLKSESAARRIFFRDEPDLAIQLRRWRGRRLERLVQRLGAVHRDLLADNRNAELVLAQALAEITRAARGDPSRSGRDSS
jgi:DNA polymerase-3 subunit delta